MFLKITADEYINTEEIVHIKVVDSMTCLLSTENGIYTANMPVETLMAMLKEKPEESKEIGILEQMNKKIGELPIFAG